MRRPALAVLAALTAAASPLFAAPRLCQNGLPPGLSGDLFAPVDCSTAAKPVAALPGLTAALPGKDAKADLRDLEGGWEGDLIHALGRYELLLTVKKGRGGRTSLTLEMKERQFRERLTDRLSLVPGKPSGVYEAELTSTMAPEASLKGGLIVGTATPTESPDGKSATPDRQIDVTFANGAVHRAYFAVKDKSALRVRAFSAIPGAPLQKFEVELKRTKREAL
jgi:hypothetical protein